MSFSKEEIASFAKDYASEEQGSAPAIVVDPAAIEASRRLNEDQQFFDVEAMQQITTGQQTAAVPENPKPQPVRTSTGKFAKKDGSILPRLTGKSADKGSNLYLIEGLVRMHPHAQNRGAVQAEQRRIVWANDIDEAIEKFGAYFRDLSNANEYYVVVRAGGSEAIS